MTKNKGFVFLRVVIILIAVLVTVIGGDGETAPSASSEPSATEAPATTTSATTETTAEPEADDAGAEDAAAEEADAAPTATATAAPKPGFRPQWRPPREDIYE